MGVKPNRFLAEPGFDPGVVDPWQRALVLDRSSEAFRWGNIFTTAVDLSVKAGV